MDSKEDEISIDFSKIKNFFKSKKEESNVDASMSKSGEEVVVGIKDNDKEIKIDVKEKEVKDLKIEVNDKDDDISIDFSKIKNIFKSNEKQSSDDEMPIDYGKVIDFFKKYGVIFIALMPIILSIYIRMQGAYLPFTDNWAADTVVNSIRGQIQDSINQQYPNLPDANKNAIVQNELQKVLNERQDQIDATINAYSASFKQFYQDDKGQNYMPDIDPYYWVRYAENIVKNGHPGDIIKEGKPYDNHQLAPLGRPVAGDMFHSYSIAYFYKFLSIFSSGLGLMRTSFYLPVFISAISVLLVFLIGRKIAGNMGGFFAGLAMAVNAAFLGRTLFAHADNDVWVIFFPLIITWLFVTSYDAKNALKIIATSVIAGFFTGIFTTAWNGWWYIFDFLIATVAITFFYLVLLNLSAIKANPKTVISNISTRNNLIFGALYFLSSAVFVIIFSSWATFKNSVLGPLGFTSIKAPVLTLSLWPNVLTTVAELNEGSVNQIVNSMGGPLLFFISLIGLVLAVSRTEKLRRFDFYYFIGTFAFYGALFINFGSREAPRILLQSASLNTLLAWIMLPIIIRIFISVYKKDHSYDYKLPILLSLWVISTIFASIKGVRFTLLLAPAFSVAFGVALGKIYSHLTSWLSRELKIHKMIGGSILIVLLLSLYIGPARGAIGTASSDIPIINDAWYNTLTAIKQDSKEDAIITSWWDFGHHFKYISDRHVTFDGTTQTFPPAHWVGKLLMIDNETEAIGILRMLDCGSNSAYDELYNSNNDTHLSLRILNQIIVLGKEDAKKRLKEYKIDDTIVDRILSYTHCDPPEAYFIASEDMIGKSGVWAHFGSWNFERADLWKNARVKPQEEAVSYMMSKFNYTRERAENLYFEMKGIENEPNPNRRDSLANQWVAPWPGYAGSMTCAKGGQGLFSCPPLGVGNNVALTFKVDMDNYDVFAEFQGSVLKPSSGAFVTENGIVKRRFSNASITGHGMAVIPLNNEEIEVIISSDELAGSIFTRMFYMNGHGLKYFKLFKHERGLTGTNIYTYKIDWKGTNATIVGAYVDFIKAPPADNIP